MNARRLILSVVAAVVASLVFASAPALAAEAPEAPGPATVEAVTARSATFRGELNPGKTGPAGTYDLDTYEFLYNKGGSCEGGSKAPEPAGMSLGAGQEGLPPQAVSGLQPATEYAGCLLVRNSADETVVGSSVTFTTSTAPPTIASESVANVEATAATLEAEIDPDGVETTYHFEYGTTRSLRPGHCGVRIDWGRQSRPRRDCQDRRVATRHDLPLPSGGHQLAEPRRWDAGPR